MLHILLMILKILGIILLCLIGIVLLLIALVLFVPVRYRIKAVKEDTIDENGQKSGFAESFYARIKATWLCHFVSVTVEYKGEVLCKVRVLGIVVYDLTKKEEYAAKKAEKENRKEEKERRKAKEKTTPATTNTEEVSALESKGENKQETKANDTVEKASEEQDEQTTEKQETEAKEDEKLTLLQKIKQFIHKLKELFHKILDAIRNIKYTIESFCDKIKDAVNQVEYYKEVWEKEETKQALATGKKELGHLLKHLKPSKFKADIRLGLADPATMGQVLSIHGMLYPFLGKNVRIVPDFDKEVLEGNIYIKGRITVFVLLQVAWILYFDKNIRYLIRLLKKEDK